MRKLRLHQAARAWQAAAAPRQNAAVADRLSDLAPLRDNPGNLRARCYVPDGLGAGAPLVVVLHGCTQNAAAYDHGSGWSRLADRRGFALLFPEQQRANNPNLCFNWFNDGDTRRGRGEAASIRSMVDAMAARHGIDPARIFVTGLSAGGAMASVMLAAYPELFAGGAIIAGIAYGCASGVAEAFDCMAGRASAGAAELGARVRAASPHRGPWPRVSVWQGSADGTVVPRNAEAIVLQWRDLHGLPPQPDRVETVEGHARRVWTDAGGEALIEHYLIAGMGHGTPLRPGTGEGRSGAAGPHMLDAAISSTDRIAAFFGLAPEPPARAEAGRKQAAPGEAPPPPAAAGARPANAVQKTIEDALRKAGLIRP